MAGYGDGARKRIIYPRRAKGYFYVTNDDVDKLDKKNPTHFNLPTCDIVIDCGQLIYDDTYRLRISTIRDEANNTYKSGSYKNTCRR